MFNHCYIVGHRTPNLSFTFTVILVLFVSKTKVSTEIVEGSVKRAGQQTLYLYRVKIT